MVVTCVVSVVVVVVVVVVVRRFVELFVVIKEAHEVLLLPKLVVVVGISELCSLSRLKLTDSFRQDDTELAIERFGAAWSLLSSWFWW